MMAWLKKRKQEKCTHKWYYVGKTTIRHRFCGHIVEEHEMNALYCPICEKEISVSDERWEQLQAISLVKETHQRDMQMKELGLSRLPTIP